MYQVIARKYRPQTFRDVVNQEHVKTTLENAIAQKRIAHGYIFSGQRGTGKTTVARILARCLNCVEGPTVTPCGACSSCLEITGGGTVDVIEIDAASNRGINEMRELRENVRYQPARDRYKVFIVDEAHQITSEAFNALLKTIEEPPPWAVFILCTTEAHKIPATIASRCQHFSFRSVDFEDLMARMAWICEQEGIQTDPDVLAVLAQAGEGSVRDSLSALDQAIACCGATLSASEVRALLGAFSLESLEQVSQALAENNSARMLEVVDELERNGHNLQHFSRELSRYFRNLLVARIAGAETRLIAASPAQREKLAAIARQFSEEDLTRYLQLSLDLFRDLQFSLQPRFHLEIGLVRLVQAGKLVSLEEALAGLPSAANTTAPARPARNAPAQSSPPRPSPFEMDRARKTQAPGPASEASPGPRPLAPGPASEPSPGPRSQAPGPASEANRLPALGPASEASPRPRPQAPEPASEASPGPRPPAPGPASAANRLPALGPASEASPSPRPKAPGPASVASPDWRQRLHTTLVELGMQFTADAVENSRVAEQGADLVFTTPKEYARFLAQNDMNRAFERLGVPTKRIRVVAADAGGEAAPLAAAPRQDYDAEAANRALANPEVQRFREVFGGEVRKVRNLKE